jgi:integrase
MPRGNTEPRLVTRQNKHWSGPAFYIRWYDENGRVRHTATGTDSSAEAAKKFARWLEDYEARQHTGRPTSPRYPAEARITDILAAHLEGHGGEVRFADRIAYAVNRLDAWWEDRTVDAVKLGTCEAYRNARLKQGVSIATVRRELSVLRAALKWAVADGRLTEAPFVKTPPAAEAKDRWLTRSEAARLLWAARKEPKARLHLPLFIMLGLYTGARSEAMLTLKWFPQVDLDRGVIDYNPPGRERTEKGRARVPIPRKLHWFLEKARARSSSPYVLSYHGESIKRIVKGFRSACKRAGLEGVTPHTLRHTCGTWLAQAGIPLWEIAGWLGHADMSTTQIYAHHHPEALAAPRYALDRPRKTRRTA